MTAARPTPSVLFTESSLNIGGQELQQLTQMQALRARGWETLLVCHPASRIREEAQARGLPVATAALRSAGDLRSIAATRAHIAALRPLLVACHSQHDAYIASLAARTVWRRPPVLRMRTYMGSVNPLLFNHLVDLTLTPSQALREQVLARGGGRVAPDKVSVLYPGIDFDALQRRADAPLDRSALEAWLAAGRGPVLLLASMLRPEKGHAVLLQALARLRRDWPGLRCVLAGEGELRPQIEAMVAELGLSDSVHIAGMVSNVAPLMKRVDLVVMPSLAEPLGMSQIEALALGTPVVASRVGGIPETIEHERTGWLVEPGDVDAWVAALDRALRQPELARTMAQAGGSAVRTRFSIEANLAQLLRYAELAGA